MVSKESTRLITAVYDEEVKELSDSHSNPSCSLYNFQYSCLLFNSGKPKYFYWNLMKAQFCKLLMYEAVMFLDHCSS